MEYTEYEVKQSSNNELVGQIFCIISSAEADGTTMYDIYETDGTSAGTKVTFINPE